MKKKSLRIFPSITVTFGIYLSVILMYIFNIFMSI